MWGRDRRIPRCRARTRCDGLRRDLRLLAQVIVTWLFSLRILVYWVINESGQVTLEHFLLSRYLSQFAKYHGFENVDLRMP